MRRFFDVVFAIIGLIMLSPIMIVLFTIGLFDTGSPIFTQKRIGLEMKVFDLIKFRTMYKDTQTMPTHLVQVDSITKWGAFLRRSKLDELPQLINVLVGDMSFVGPRPNLINQEELIRERYNNGVYKVRPGITGLAQITKIDMSNPHLLALTDARMINELNIFQYFKYIFLTLLGKGFGDRVKI